MIDINDSLPRCMVTQISVTPKGRFRVTVVNVTTLVGRATMIGNARHGKPGTTGKDAGPDTYDGFENNQNRQKCKNAKVDDCVR